MSPTRRSTLALAAAGLAGCTASPGDTTSPRGTDDPDRQSPTPSETPTPSPTPTAEPARPVVRSVGVPGTVRIDESFTARVTVANDGGRPAAVALPLYADADGEWARVDGLDLGELSPGERRTIESDPLAASYLPKLRLRVGDDEAGATVAVRPALRRLDDAFRTAGGVALTVTGVTLAGDYEFHADGEVRTAHPAPDRQWALVDVAATNPTKTPARAPTYDEFRLVRSATDAQFDPLAYRDDVARYSGGRLLSGTARRGTVLFAGPDGIGQGDLRVAWSRVTPEGPQTVYWMGP